MSQLYPYRQRNPSGRDARTGRPETTTMLAPILFAYTKLTRLCCGEDGQALLEYALILGLVSIVCVSALSLLGATVNNLLGPIVGAF
jgi:Flp pilus assembly pilin Flp